MDLIIRNLVVEVTGGTLREARAVAREWGADNNYDIICMTSTNDGGVTRLVVTYSNPNLARPAVPPTNLMVIND